MRRLALAMLAVALLVPACSGSGSGSAQSGASATPPTSASQPAAHNAADTAFAQNMIPHHQQAVDMAMTVLNKGTDEKVHALAQRIALAQQPEIDLMTGWLKAWGEPTMSAGHGMATMTTMPGMMSDEQMRRFQAASGAALDRMFLTMMIEHHQGAVTMAETELRDGLNADAQQLAQRIKDSQTKEIAEMRAMLQGR